MQSKRLRCISALFVSHKIWRERENLFQLYYFGFRKQRRSWPLLINYNLYLFVRLSVCLPASCQAIFCTVFAYSICLPNKCPSSICSSCLYIWCTVCVFYLIMFSSPSSISVYTIYLFYLSALYLSALYLSAVLSVCFLSVNLLSYDFIHV